MANFCPVAPIQVLEQMYASNPYVFGEHHLLLAHHTDEHHERFFALFRRIANDGLIKPLVIMDNSVVELGGYVDVNMMRRTVACLKEATYGSMKVVAVLPDVMGDGEATRVAVAQSYSTWERTVPTADFMAVCQGRNIGDYCSSVLEFTHPGRYWGVSWLGIPRFLVGLIGTRREAVLQAISSRRAGQSIHLLGYSDNMVDDVACSRIQGVDTIDSAVPLRYAHDWTQFVDAGPRPQDWFDTAQYSNQVMRNLSFARHLHLSHHGQAIEEQQ